MSTNSLHTVLVTAMAICLAAVLAVATTWRERSTGRTTPAGYDLLQMEDAISSR